MKKQENTQGIEEAQSDSGNVNGQKKRPEIHDDEISIGRGWCHITKKDRWTEGDVVTPNGLVLVYAQGDDETFYHSRLDFAFNGRLYIRNFKDRRYTKIGLSRLAKRFADEIVEREATSVLVRQRKGITDQVNKKL